MCLNLNLLFTVVILCNIYLVKCYPNPDIEITKTKVSLKFCEIEINNNQ